MTWTTRRASECSGNIAARVIGAGPKVVLIHGVGLRGEAWCAVAEELSTTFEVHTVDMPGHGLSPLKEASCLSDYVDRIAAYIHALGAPVRLAGHSMGAMIAIEAASRTSLSISAVAALNAIYRRSPEASDAVRARAQALIDMDRADPEPTLARWFGSAPQGIMKDAADICRAWLTQGNIEGYKAAYSVFAHQDGPADAALQNLSCPALFLTGDQDLNSTPEMSRCMAKLCSWGEAQVFDDAAHMLPMTQSSETAGVLRQFFSAADEGMQND